MSFRGRGANAGKEAILLVEILSLVADKSPHTETTDEPPGRVSEEFCFESCSLPQVNAKKRRARGAAGPEGGHPPSPPISADFPSRKFRCLGLIRGFQ